MVEKYNIRTDLALEEKERFESDQVEVQGVVLEEEYDKEREIRVTTVRIETENGAKTMGKPVGTYLTIEARIYLHRMRESTGRFSEETGKISDRSYGKNHTGK